MVVTPRDKNPEGVSHCLVPDASWQIKMGPVEEG